MEEIEWCDMVELYYQSTTVPGDAATQLAEKTSKKLGEKTLFVDGVKHYSTLEVCNNLKHAANANYTEKKYFRLFEVKRSFTY